MIVGEYPSDPVEIDWAGKIYAGVDAFSCTHGKRTLFLRSRLPAMKNSQHLTDI